MSEAVAPKAIGPAAAIGRVLSDERLARRAVKGDERAFATIFDRYHQRLYRYCLAIVGNPQDAQDALQNTMVKALQALPGEERRIELKPWLYRIAHNESIELLRRRRDTRELDGELAAPGSGLAEEVASRERLRQLLVDLDELPERQRGALVMRELSGLDFAAIGTALGTSPAVARQTVYEARLSLRQMDEGRDMNCETVTRALSGGDGRVGRRRDLRAHLRDCSSCRRFGEEIDARQRDLAALAPLPAVAAAGLLQGLLGGGGGAGGGGLAGAVGGATVKSVGASVALKGAATVAVVAAIGVGAADRGGLIDAGLPGSGGPRAAEVEQPVGPDPVEAKADRLSDSAAAGADPSAAARRRDLGRSQEVAEPGVAAAGEETSAGAVPPPASPDSFEAEAGGKGREKQLPAAAAHGQQTAATHKGASHGSAGSKSHPAHPTKPSHPAKPAKPAKPAHPSTPRVEKAPPAPPPAPAAAPLEPKADDGSAPIEPETGKKP